MSILLKKTQEELKKYSTPEAKAATLKFVPNAKKVYGIRTPVLNELAKKYKEGGFELVDELWKSGAFEEQMLAAKMLRHICRKDHGKALRFVKKFSKGVSNWAVCDTLGMQSLKPIAKKIQQEIFDLSKELMQSSNYWQRRLSLVLIEVFTKDKLLHPEIEKRAIAFEKDEEYYVRKAVVWIKRNLKKGR